MAIKIDNAATIKLPKNFERQMDKIIDAVPKEHLRGLERVKLVDFINDPRLKASQSSVLPGLYHPRQGTKGAWAEIAVGQLLPDSQPLGKRLMSRLSFKGNFAAVVFSLIGQHYYLTLRHSVKKGQLEMAIRAYTEKHLRSWGEKEHSLRARLFKPFQPTLEKWAKALQKQAKTKQKMGK